MNLLVILLVSVYVYSINGDFRKYMLYGVCFNLIFVDSLLIKFLASFFKKCNRKDLDFMECCIKASADGFAHLTKAIPEYGLPNLNPMVVPIFPISVDSNGNVSTDPNFTNCEIYGLTNIQVKRFEYNNCN